MNSTKVQKIILQNPLENSGLGELQWLSATDISPHTQFLEKRGDATPRTCSKGAAAGESIATCILSKFWAPARQEGPGTFASVGGCRDKRAAGRRRELCTQVARAGTRPGRAFAR